VQLKCEAIGLV